jgi:hypothetical protein
MEIRVAAEQPPPFLKILPRLVEGDNQPEERSYSSISTEQIQEFH